MDEQDWTDFPLTKQAVEATEETPVEDAEDLTLGRRLLRGASPDYGVNWVDSGSGPGWSPC